MKKLFLFGCLGLILFEIANVYFIMPMPGSQQMNSVDVAYFLYRWRWYFRVFFLLALLFGLFKSKWKRLWVTFIPLSLLVLVVYFTNFKMAAEVMFKQPKELVFSTSEDNKVDLNRLVIGVVNDGVAKAYPIQFLGYHHFVMDEINGQNVLVTYCTVCRTGRVFDPVVNGTLEEFRLVGMDHFNAMLEDKTTKSWWRQSTGEAITGKLKGQFLLGIQSSQTSLEQWLKLYPDTEIMQADESFIEKYPITFEYEDGTSRKKLTGTDSLSWKNKSWIIGVKIDDHSMAFDWNDLLKNRVLQSELENTHVFVVLAKDNKSFFAFENISKEIPEFKNDTIFINSKKYTLNGVGIDTSFSLKQINAYQEFWYSWKTFQPDTKY